jgi:acyl carrier protein
MLGAWLLHQATLDQRLDFFVLHSSGTVFVGNPGQANYVAGCAYLETLAEYRRSLGLPALAIGWGAISDVGYVARNAEVVEILSSRIGLKMLTSAQAMAAMHDLLAVGASRVIVAHVDWQRLRQGMPASSAAPKYSVVLTGGSDGEAITPAGELRATLEAMRPSQRRAAMTRRLGQLLGHVMGTAGAEIDPNRALTELGIDSLMAVEIGAMVEEDLGIKLPTMELLDLSAADLANRLLEIAGLTVEDAGATVGSVSPAELAAMNEEQVDELLEELTKGDN